MLEGSYRLARHRHHLESCVSSHPYPFSTNPTLWWATIAWSGFDSLEGHPMTSSSGSVTNCRQLRVAAGLEWRSSPATEVQ